jgi:hypothetical protein
MNREEAKESIRKKIEGAYHERKDYPPYALMSWDDRARYHQYIMKLIEEWANE